MERVKEAIERLKEAEAVYIYGAGDVAREVAFCLMDSPYRIKVEAFLVSDNRNMYNEKILGKPIISYKEIAEKKNIEVIIAVLEKYRDEIIGNLRDIGVGTYVCLTFESDLWCEIRAKFFKDKEKESYIYLEEALNVSKLLEQDSHDAIAVYVAKSHVDKKLCEEFQNREWEREIQVGAALTRDRVCVNADDNGDNISLKNRQYCELTALYWIWKNTNEDWVGLSHYRRRFLISDKELKQLVHSDIDAVFTTPVLNEPNVKYMYAHNHSDSDWKIMKQAVALLQPAYLVDVEKVEEEIAYVPYNMFIMRRAFLNAYCEWLFPILEYCENEIGKKDDVYQNRYIGFLAERLMSVYYLHNATKYKMVFAHKHFIESKVDG